MIDRRIYGIDVVVMDCVTVSETASRQTLGSSTGKKKMNQQNKKEATTSGRRALELSAIEGCVKRPASLPSSNENIKVVTIDWVVHCLQVIRSNKKDTVR